MIDTTTSSAVALEKLSDELGWNDDTKILVLSGYLGEHLDVNNFTDATLEYVNKSGLPVKTMLYALCAAADMDSALRQTTFVEYVNEVAAAARRQKLSNIQPGTIFIDASKPQTTTYELSKDWTAEARRYLAMTTAAPGEALGRVLASQVYVSLSPGYEVRIEVVNAKPHAVIDAYMLLNGKSVCSIPPQYELKAGLLRFDHNNEHVEVKVPNEHS